MRSPVVATAMLLTVSVAPTQGQTSDEARQFLDTALEILETRALYRDSVNWERVRSDAYDMARSAENPSDTYPAIRFAIAQLGDGHSFLSPASESTGSDDNPERARPEGRIVSGDIGLVVVPGFAGPDRAQFTTEIDHVLADLDRPGLCGWIVDLRGNEGGNMWPMLLGLRPLIGPPPVGAFQSPTGTVMPWQYRTIRPLRRLNNPQPPVAVLTDKRTASSGEAIVVAFHGRQDTRSFGEPTWGLSTSNQRFALPDGSALYLTVAVFVDRVGEVFGGPIVPDSVLDPSVADQAAVEWLHGRCGDPNRETEF